MNKVIDNDCIFCKIANGEIPSNKIYEDDYFLVMLDINPASNGHAVLLPKTHAANIYELPDEYLEKALKVAAKCAAAIKKATNCDGINILQNNGEVAGQTVFHFHIHIIPRYVNDSVNITWKQLECVNPQELAQNIRDSF